MLTLPTFLVTRNTLIFCLASFDRFWNIGKNTEHVPVSKKMKQLIETLLYVASFFYSHLKSLLKRKF